MNDFKVLGQFKPQDTPPLADEQHRVVTVRRNLELGFDDVAVQVEPFEPRGQRALPGLPVRTEIKSVVDESGLFYIHVALKNTSSADTNTMRSGVRLPRQQ